MARRVSTFASQVRLNKRLSSFQEVASCYTAGSRIPGRTLTSTTILRRELSSSPSSVVSDHDENDFNLGITNSASTRVRNNPSAVKSAAVSSIEDNLVHQRIWRPKNESTTAPLYWSQNVVQSSQSNPNDLVSLLDRIEKQELSGGRMRAKQNGVLHEDPAVDMRLLMENYTVNSLASALRDREEMLQMASQMAANNDFEMLKDFLRDCHPDVVLEKRQKLRRLNLQEPLNLASLEIIRKGLMRMPRQVTMAHSKRAGVVIAIVHVDGVPSLLFEKRSASLRAHPDEVCLPGGMVCDTSDRTIVETCLREMKEEIGGFDFDYHRDTGGTHGVSVLGTLRCNWGEGKEPRYFLFRLDCHCNWMSHSFCFIFVVKFIIWLELLLRLLFVLSIKTSPRWI